MTVALPAGALRRRRGPGGLGDERLPGRDPAAARASTPSTPRTTPPSAACSGSCRSSPRRPRREGYSRDLCSYARTDLGSVAHRARRRSAGCPGPTCSPAAPTSARRSSTGTGRWPSTSRCRWCSSTRPSSTATATAAPPRVRDATQLEELVARRRARRAAGALDPEALVEVTRGAARAAGSGASASRTARHRPAPWTGFDGFFHMAPIVALRGTEACNAYYRLLRDELARPRRARASAGMRDERHRLLWDNLPIWFAIRELSTLLAERGFNFVCTSYTNAWAEAGSGIDPADPLGSAAHGLHPRHPQPGPARTGSASCGGSRATTASTGPSSTATAPASPTRSARST